MTLATGARLGPYEILSALGAGGMGEVYRATDTKLKRAVAIKVLPASVAGDPDRLARFQREAEVLASLNHPNIAAIYGIEDTTDAKALVMELVEGPTLADRIEQAAIPLDEALPIARQIAEALEAAHEQGIIHRDLKPANIKVRPDGTVKVLDFGLAKAMDPTGSSAANATMSPTLSMHATMAGVILGTAAYMSPEQARGATVDRRADIWAFGVVLYEMLTGRRLFDGATVSDTLAFVLTKEPDWNAFPAHVPLTVRRLLRRCLEKDPKQRLQAIGEARIQIEEALGGATEESAPIAISLLAPRWRRALPWAVASALGLGLAGVLLSAPWRTVPSPAKVSFDIPTENATSAYQFALSPNGARLVGIVNTSRGTALWVRRLDEVAPQTLVGTTGAQNPFWSPDGRFIAFFTAGKLNKIDIFGGPAQPLCNAPSGTGGTWNRDGVIVFAPSENGPLFKVSAGGGVPVAITELDKSRGDTGHRRPNFLPDGRHFVFFVLSAKPESSGLYLGALDSRDTRRLVASDVTGAFAPPDHLLFMRASTLMAQRFDPGRLELQGDPFPVAEGVGSNVANSVAGFAFSDTGMLAFRPGATVNNDRVLRWVDRSGKPLGDLGGASHENVALEPDGQQLVETRRYGQASNIWVFDLSRGASTRLTFDPGIDDNAIWSPEGNRLAFASARNDSVRNLYVKGAGGAGQEELLLKTDFSKYPTDWSRDGQYILYTEVKTSADVWVLPLSGEKKPIPLLNTPFQEGHARFSPDAHWIAYASDESGANQVYVQSFPLSGGKWQISSTGGIEPQWRGDGRELFYVNGGAVWSVEVSADSDAFKVGAPKKLFDASLNTSLLTTLYNVTRDGQRFLLSLIGSSASGVPPIRVVLNWDAALKH